MTSEHTRQLDEIRTRLTDRARGRLEQLALELRRSGHADRMTIAVHKFHQLAIIAAQVSRAMRCLP